MTFCLGMKADEGLVGIAHTRVTTGAECITVNEIMGDTPAHGLQFGCVKLGQNSRIKPLRG